MKNTTLARDLFQYFRVMLVDEARPRVPDMTLFTQGYVLNFTPTAQELAFLRREVGMANVARTLFTVDEIRSMSVNEKIQRQLLHYFFVYGCGAVVDFVHPTDNSKTMPLKLVRGVSRADVAALVTGILATDAPAKDTATLKNIITELDLPYTFSDIKNRELRIALYRPGVDQFTSGDDAVRYMCYVCAGSDLLIKSQDVVRGVMAGASKLPASFVRTHAAVLAEVFNRHKKLIMALKMGDRKFAHDVNVVSRMSKRRHRPMDTHPAKRFFADFAAGRPTALHVLTVRDKFKLLSLIEYKRMRLTSDIYPIRNGKVFVKESSSLVPTETLTRMAQLLLESLRQDLQPLQSATIVLDPNVDYGLPVSRKQSVGQLPFGTVVRVWDQPLISSGVYWTNSGGASDIDLSTVDESGARVGWGRMSGYSDPRVTFSGDITDAPKGAMEFMTSGMTAPAYGLFVNIFRGECPSEIELVVGGRGARPKRGDWIDAPMVREKFLLQSKQTLLGFVTGTTFTVFTARVGSGRMSSEKDRMFLAKAQSFSWTVSRLLECLNIPYTTEPTTGTIDHDLRYSGFTIDKLEKMLYTK